MSPAYINAVIENLPYASIVFDHFHIIKFFKDKLSDFRRGLFRETTDILRKNVQGHKLAASYGSREPGR